eukprot:TRINITY_DN1331_c1_g2_i1.p1 TRINITY_DN1331_c1_g2~~TRINITY_DN1331_c1_g2_i1.p1  ORF type:complete len:389 (+),score=63.77 TRINITY_DN1331_c1_g2_i1:1-1167(+)
MSHRKFEAPRHGHLGFLPRKRTRHHRGRIRSFPKDDRSKPCHFTAFPVFKAGMTHITRDVHRIGSRLHKKEVVEAVTILEAPPMTVVGLVGYIDTPKGLRALTTVWTSTLSDNLRRRFYKNWTQSKRKAFTKYTSAETHQSTVTRDIAKINKYCTVVRALCHSNPSQLTNHRQKKAHLMEIQVNGGSIADKVKFVQERFEQEIRVDTVFQKNEMSDVIGVTKGHGFTGVHKRFGVRLLPKKTHRGYRRVGCVGSWHPTRLSWTVARAGQHGYHHRTETNKKIYRIGQGELSGAKNNASTENDLTEKNITPMGGFPHYGQVREDYVMIKGCCVGHKRRMVVLRKPIVPRTSRVAQEDIKLKFIDTASKMGHGRFQTTEEKNRFFGITKE